MEKIQLASTMREVFGKKTKKGRRDGKIPAVVYGKTIESKSLWISYLDFSRLIRKSGESTMIELSVDGKENHNVIIYETQKDPLSGRFIHVDFFKVRMDEEIETEVELVFVGESPAVKELGGVLVKNMDEVTVKCLPADLLSHIDVDISGLKTFDDHICIKDLGISKKVTIDIDPETVIALVNPPRSEDEMSQLEEKVEADVTKVEGVIKEEPKKEEEKKQ